MMTAHIADCNHGPALAHASDKALGCELLGDLPIVHASGRQLAQACHRWRCGADELACRGPVYVQLGDSAALPGNFHQRLPPRNLDRAQRHCLDHQA
jgi:hypothetical protein